MNDITSDTCPLDSMPLQPEELATWHVPVLQSCHSDTFRGDRKGRTQLPQFIATVASSRHWPCLIKHKMCNAPEFPGSFQIIKAFYQADQLLNLLVSNVTSYKQIYVQFVLLGRPKDAWSVEYFEHNGVAALPTIWQILFQPALNLLHLLVHYTFSASVTK